MLRLWLLFVYSVESGGSRLVFCGMSDSFCCVRETEEHWGDAPGREHSFFGTWLSLPVFKTLGIGCPVGDAIVSRGFVHTTKVPLS